MGDVSKIGWTNATWNPWYGCTKVSAGCDNCYMFRWARRAGKDPEVVTRAAWNTFNAPYRYQRKLKPGQRELVFTCSLGDFFHRDADAWREDAFEIIRKTPRLTYQVLTKRHGRVRRHLPTDWGCGWPHVWLGVSVEDGGWLRRARTLLDVEAAVRFLSIEPLVSEVDPTELRAVLRDGIHWVIVGGESGGRGSVRPFVERDALAIVEACAAEGVACFVKQRGTITMKLEGGMELVPLGELAEVRPELDAREYPSDLAQDVAGDLQRQLPGFG